MKVKVSSTLSRSLNVRLMSIPVQLSFSHRIFSDDVNATPNRTLKIFQRGEINEMKIYSGTYLF